MDFILRKNINKNVDSDRKSSHTLGKYGALHINHNNDNGGLKSYKKCFVINVGCPGVGRR